MQAAVEACAAKFGGIDICVNNASAISLTGTEATEMKRYDLMHQVNARGTFLVSKACIPHLKQGRQSACADAVAAAGHERRNGSRPIRPIPWRNTA